jgi:hypothetical protein
MVQISSSELYTIAHNYKTFSESDLSYYYNRLTKRMQYLQPLLNEVKEKNLDLKTISNELFQEVWQVEELIEFLKQFIKNGNGI